MAPCRPPLVSDKPRVRVQACWLLKPARTLPFTDYRRDYSDIMPEASNSGEGSTNGASTRHARLVGELPPQVNLRPEDSNGRPRPQGDDDEEDSNEDDDAGSDFDETTVKGEGGLAAKIVQLDEREFEDKKRRSEKEDGDGEQAGIEELSTNPDAGKDT